MNSVHLSVPSSSHLFVFPYSNSLKYIRIFLNFKNVIEEYHGGIFGIENEVCSLFTGALKFNILLSMRKIIFGVF